MTTITINTRSLSESREVLTSVYEADRSATYVGKDIVSGSVLTARADKNSVVISSGYYNEYSLTQMFEA